MKNNLRKTALICILMGAIGPSPSLADGSNDDGAAAAHGQMLLEKWRKHPATPAKLALVTPGKAYVARKSKLEPGAYSVYEMARIAAAGSNKSAKAVTMMQIEGHRPMQPSHTSQGERSLAATFSVDAKDYSLSELAKMKFTADN